MKVQISDHFNFKKLIQFTIPSIVMMIFLSIYNVVDGYFVSNYAGKTQFAAVNLIMPFLMLLGGIGFMFGTGGNALVSNLFGLSASQSSSLVPLHSPAGYQSA